MIGEALSETVIVSLCFSFCVILSSVQSTVSTNLSISQSVCRSVKILSYLSVHLSVRSHALTILCLCQSVSLTPPLSPLPFLLVPSPITYNLETHTITLSNPSHSTVGASQPALLYGFNGVALSLEFTAVPLLLRRWWQ